MASYIVGVVVLIIITLAIVKITKDKINHKSSCANCSGCSIISSCKPNDKQQKAK